MKRTLFAALLVLSFVYSTPSMTPPLSLTETKISATDAFIEQQFGSALAVDGNTAVVGAPNHSVVADGSGAAYVYVRTASGWQFQQKLTASDATPQSFFGMSVAINNDTIVVGAHGDANAGFSSGAAYVFVRSGNTWVQQQKLTGSENSPSDSFGLSVGIKGNTIVCGAFGNSPFNTITWGTAYVFTRTGNAWIESQKLAASDASDFNNFGITVALFGYRLGISGDTIVAASQGRVEATIDTSIPSAVYVFRRTPSGWHQQKRIFITDSGLLGQFGLTAAVSGDTIVIGSSGDSTIASASGSAYVYRRNGESKWVFTQKLFASDAARDDAFGSTVAVSGNTVLVGAVNKSDVALLAGAAYLFDFDF
jgi:hypothetical protein